MQKWPAVGLKEDDVKMNRRIYLLFVLEGQTVNTKSSKQNITD